MKVSRRGNPRGCPTLAYHLIRRRGDSRIARPARVGTPPMSPGPPRRAPICPQPVVPAKAEPAPANPDERATPTAHLAFPFNPSKPFLRRPSPNTQDPPSCHPPHCVVRTQPSRRRDSVRPVTVEGATLPNHLIRRRGDSRIARPAGNPTEVTRTRTASCAPAPTRHSCEGRNPEGRGPAWGMLTEGPPSKNRSRSIIVDPIRDSVRPEPVEGGRPTRTNASH